MSAREQMASTMTEREWQALVVAFAELHGWTIYHTHDSRRSAPGFPDLVMARDARLIFAELKTSTGRVSRDQQRWLGLLERVAVGNPEVEVAVWRPGDEDQAFASLSRR